IPRASNGLLLRLGALILAVVAVMLVACSSAGENATGSSGGTPTPVTRAARTAAARDAATPVPRLATAPILLDPITRRPIWLTPPPSCLVSPAGEERPDLGPTIGETPIWVASAALPVIPWRNEFVRTVWVIDRSAPGDLVLSGRRTDEAGAVQFIRQGGERATEQLHVPSAGRIGA